MRPPYLTDIGSERESGLNLTCLNFTISVVGTTAQTPPAEGVFYAQPVTVLSSDSESDIDTDDAQTVIFKSSPYSSPGPGIMYYPVSVKDLFKFLTWCHIMLGLSQPL